MKALKMSLLALCIAIFFVQCKKENAQILRIEAKTAKIKYGSFFGECIGYCTNTIEVSENQVVLKQNGWNLEGTLSEKTISMSISENQWNELIININDSAFAGLPATIGCPDCADGGGEWIEITDGTSTHKVTFEYGKEPEQVKNFIGILRNYMNELHKR